MSATSAGLGLRGLINSVLMTLMSKMWVFVLGMLLAFLRGRFLGPELLAALLLSLTLPYLLFSIFNMGVSIANVYYIGRGQITQAKALHSSLKMGIVLSGIGCAFGGVLIAQGAETFYPGVDRNLLWGALLVYPMLLIRSYAMSLLQAGENFRWFNLIHSTEAACVLLLTTVAFFTFGGTAFVALVAFGIATLISLGLCAIPVRQQLRLAAGTSHASQGESSTRATLKQTDGDNATEALANDGVPDQETHYFWRYLSYGWKSNLSNLLSYLNHRLDLLLINFFVTPAAAGIYAGATLVTERIWILSQAVSTVIMPRLSRLDTGDPSRRLLTRLVSNIVFLSTLALSFVLAIFGEWILGLLLGPKFVSGAVVLRWLLPGTVLAGLARVLANDLAARGMVGWNICNAALLVVVNVMANVLLIPQYGIIGAAWSSSLGWVVYTLMAVLVYCRVSHVVWWELIIPRPKDVNELLQRIGKWRPIARARHRIATNTETPHVTLLFVKRGSSLKRRALVTLSISLIGGMTLTAYFEHPQTKLIVPLRNLWLFGQMNSREGELNETSQYRHGTGTNPVHVALTVRETALDVLDRAENSRTQAIGKSERDRLLRVADYFLKVGKKSSIRRADYADPALVDSATDDHGRVAYRLWPYDFDFPKYDLHQPWYSGMAQGYVIEVELAAYHLVGDARYLNAACDAGRALGVPLSQGGVAVVLPKGEGIWFEEYASSTVEPPFVLNGHNFALNGLWHLSRVSPEFRPLFDAGVAALSARLPAFDAGVWSWYDRRGNAANQKYQMIHVDQLYELSERTGDSRLGAYAKKFQRQLWNPLQVCYRLYACPTRMLLLLCFVNAMSVGLAAACLHRLIERGVCRLRIGTRANDGAWGSVSLSSAFGKRAA